MKFLVFSQAPDNSSYFGNILKLIGDTVTLYEYVLIVHQLTN